MLQGFTGWHLLIVLAVILLLFGAAKLPALAKSMGQSARVFRSEIKEMKKDDVVDPPESPVATASADAPVTRNVSNVSADTVRGNTDPTP